jgi:hypothetical protein
MRLNAPKKNIWLISIIVGILGIVATFIAIPFVSVYAFWFVAVAFVLLLLGTTVKGM